MGPRHVDVSYLPALNEAGEVTGVVVRAHDTHSLKQREKELEGTVALLEHKTLEQERFIHIISHDLREPINTITNFAGLLVEDESLALPDHAQRYLWFVRSGGLRMKSLLEDLLNFLHLDHHAIKRTSVDLTQLAVDIRDDLGATLADKGGRIEFDQLHTANGDATLLRILLQNLVSNGLKFSKKGIPPLVKISSSVENGLFQLQVCDNGIGVAADQTANIFGMFTRLHSKKEYEGSGLGLSICRRIAELHRGSVSATSEVGTGSCFTLHLPLASAITEESNGDEFL
jgi:light-regulated signal transduction histidine kinase (bacteriophytochrome)